MIVFFFYLFIFLLGNHNMHYHSPAHDILRPLALAKARINLKCRVIATPAAYVITVLCIATVALLVVLHDAVATESFFAVNQTVLLAVTLLNHSAEYLGKGTIYAVNVFVVIMWL